MTAPEGPPISNYGWYCGRCRSVHRSYHPVTGALDEGGRHDPRTGKYVPRWYLTAEQAELMQPTPRPSWGVRVIQAGTRRVDALTERLQDQRRKDSRDGR